MKRFFLTVLAAILMAVSLHAADKIYKLQSPSGELSVEISAGKELRWSVEMQGVNILEPSHSGNASEPGPFILTNSSQYNGAAVLFYPEMLRKLCGLFQGGYYVLPISIHEVLIIPESDSPDEYRLCGMLFTGNRSVVEEADVLSDKVLHFDPGRECLSVVQAGGMDVISEENSFEKNSRSKQLDCVQEPVQYPA